MKSAFRLIWAVILLLAADEARASTELRTKLGAAAKSILANTKNQTVSVGEFTQTGLRDARVNSGPGIERLLSEALEQAQPGCVKSNAPFEVKGDYALVNSKAVVELKAIKLSLRIIDNQSGEELKDLRVEA